MHGSRLIVPVLLVAVIAAFAVAKEDKNESKSKAKSDGARVKHDPKTEAMPLGKTIKLNFKIKEEETQRLTITTATTEYGTSFSYSDQGSNAFISINGRVRFVDDKQKKLLVTATLDLRYDDDNGVFDSTGNTSATIEFNKETDLLQQQVFTLTVEAELVD